MTSPMHRLLQPLRRMQIIGLVAGVGVESGPDRTTILVHTTGGDEQELLPREVAAYCAGLAHGAWAIHTGAATLTPRSSS